MKITKEAQAQARRLMRLCIGPDGLLQEDTVRHVAATIEKEVPAELHPHIFFFKGQWSLKIKQ